MKPPAGGALVRKIDAEMLRAFAAIDCPIGIQEYVPGDDVRVYLIDGNKPMELEAVVAPHDIARVRTGLPARVELDAYPKRQYDTLDGRVTFVAPERGQHSYRVRVAVTPSPGMELRLGLPGTVTVIRDRLPLYRAVGGRLFGGR